MTQFLFFLFTSCWHKIKSKKKTFFASCHSTSHHQFQLISSNQKRETPKTRLQNWPQNNDFSKWFCISNEFRLFVTFRTKRAPGYFYWSGDLASNHLDRSIMMMIILPWTRNLSQKLIPIFYWLFLMSSLGRTFFSLLPSYFISLSLFLISFSWMLRWRTGKIPDKHLTLKLDLFPYSIYCNLFEVSMSVVLTNVRFQKTNWLNYGKCT